MENFAANCTAPQDGEKIFKTLRDWSENEYQEEMAFLGIDDSNMSWERKKILVILYMLSGVKDKEGWFYIDNANLSEICEVGERTITRVKRDFERLGIIKIKRGYQGSPTRYKFFEKKLNKLPRISKKTPESTLAALAGKNVIPANKNKVYKSVIDSLLSGYNEVPAKVDSKKIEKKFILEGGVQYKEKEQYKDKEGYEDKNQDIEQYKDKEEYEEGLMIGKIDNNIIKELVEVLFDKLDKISNSIDNNTRVQSEANTKVIESINTMVQAMVNTKDETIEELKKISTSIENTSKSNGIVQEEVNTKVVEELQGKINKLQEDYTKVVEERNYFKKRFNDSEEFFKKVKAYIPSEFLGNSKNRKESSSKSNDIVQSEVDTKGLQQEPSNEETKETPMQEQTPKADTKTASKTTVQEASKPKEVEIPKVEQIALRDEEQKQLQELKDNEIIKPLLENFTDVRFTDQGAFDKIVMEVRKAVTSGNYNQKVVQAFLDFSYTTYTFDCNLKDVLKPIEASKQEATETPSEVSNQTVEEPKQEETVTPSEESRDEDYWNPTFTDEQAQETLSRLPEANSRYEEDQEEVIDDDMPSDKEVASVVGGYDEENDEIF